MGGGGGEGDRGGGERVGGRAKVCRVDFISISNSFQLTISFYFSNVVCVCVCLMEWLLRRVKFRTAAAEFRNSVEIPLRRPEAALFRSVTIAIRSAHWRSPLSTLIYCRLFSKCSARPDSKDRLRTAKRSWRIPNRLPSTLERCQLMDRTPFPPPPPHLPPQDSWGNLGGILEESWRNLRRWIW